MHRQNWKVKDPHPEATEAFPFAIVDAKGAAVAVAKTKADAVYIADAARRISGLESDGTSYRARYLGQLASPRRQG